MYLSSKFLRSDYKIIYDIVMAAMAVCIIASLFLQSRSDITPEGIVFLRHVDSAIWLIFTIDYIIRFLAAKDKICFVKTNVIDLISILPFDVLFQGIRAVKFMRLLYMVRVFIYLSRVYKRINAILVTNDFHHILWFTFVTIFLGATAIAYIEDMNIGDALWWSFVTTTTVGYGDIAPQSVWGRIVAVALMMVGIGFISMLTGAISVFFIKQQNTVAYRDETIRQAIAKLENFSELSQEDIDDIYAVLIALKQQKLRKPPR